MEVPMSTAPPVTTSTAPRAGARPAAVDTTARTAGLGALCFVAVVVLQNVVRGGAAPGGGASAQEVLGHYATHRGTTFLLAGTFVVSGVALATFVGAAARRLLAGTRRAWATMGLVGATVVLALFSLVVAAEVALSVLASGDAPDLGAVQALWALHNAVFAVNFLAVAIALVGLAKGGVGAGITPSVFDRLAPAGAGLLAAAAVAAPAIAAGDGAVLFGLGLLGFLVWLAFLVTTGSRLVRGAVAS
jgi:hypothetical protein